MVERKVKWIGKLGRGAREMRGMWWTHARLGLERQNQHSSAKAKNEYQHSLKRIKKTYVRFLSADLYSSLLALSDFGY